MRVPILYLEFFVPTHLKFNLCNHDNIVNIKNFEKSIKLCKYRQKSVIL